VYTSPHFDAHFFFQTEKEVMSQWGKEAFGELARQRGRQAPAAAGKAPLRAWWQLPTSCAHVCAARWLPRPSAACRLPAGCCIKLWHFGCDCRQVRWHERGDECQGQQAHARGLLARRQGGHS
jgi:hypothetical protein